MGTVDSLAGYQSVPSPPSGTGILQTAASALPGAGAVSFCPRTARAAVAGPPGRARMIELTRAAEDRGHILGAPDDDRRAV
jgi:hypothetical protein